MSGCTGKCFQAAECLNGRVPAAPIQNVHFILFNFQNFPLKTRTLPCPITVNRAENSSILNVSEARSANPSAYYKNIKYNSSCGGIILWSL